MGTTVIDRSRIGLVVACIAWACEADPAPATTTVAPRVSYMAAIQDDGLNLHPVTDMAVDRDGSVWVTGATTSKTFPFTDDAIDKVFVDDDFDEGFVVKFDASGALLYATYLGGPGVDSPGGIALDDDGNVYIAGTTISTQFPTTASAYQPELKSPGAEDAFLVKLDKSGRLLASTYFGGSNRDLYPAGSRGFPGATVAVASDGSVYLAGGTASNDLPAVDGYQKQYGGGSQDVFVAKFTSSLAFERCTYLGGSNNEGAYRVALDGADNVYLLGAAARTLGQQWTFPTTPGAYLTAPSGDPLLFVAKLDASGDLAYATFLGPSAGDNMLFDTQGDLAVDSDGNAYVVGVTTSGSYPTTPGAYQTSLRGFSDLFVSKLDPSGANLVYSTYFGGGAAEYANDEAGVRIAVNGNGDAYIVGHTDSLDLPEKNSFSTTKTGRFIAKLEPSGADLSYASYLPVFRVSANALELGPAAAGTGAGEVSSVSIFIGGPTVEPRGLAVLGIDESGAPPRCAGDCDGDGFVRVNELVLGVRIALDQAQLSECMSLDSDNDGRVSVNELVRAVGALLRGCA